MKKKLELIKTIQLVLTMAIAITGLVVIFTNGELYQLIGHNRSIQILCVLLWLSLLIAFGFILADFRSISSVARYYRELDYNVSNDPVSGLANRYSCDAIIEQYADKPLPPGIGCIMLEIDNLRAINQTFGHTVGNSTIQIFSDILSSSSVDLCFVGRNGGNKFMALFEDCSEVKLNVFLKRVRQKVDTHDQQPGVPPLEYRCGRAFHEDPSVTSITQLIALADRRISNTNDKVTGIPNRNSCDEIIDQYQDRPLPRTVGCIMIEFVNLKAINDACGRITGNQALRSLSDILREKSRDLCFVGRNGGTRFLAIFEGWSNERIETFMDNVTGAIEAYNRETGHPEIHITWGSAFDEQNVDSIGQLLACATERLNLHQNF